MATDTFLQHGQAPYLQVLNTHYRMILADDAHSFVQVIAAGVANAGMNFLDAGLRLIPVAAECLLTTHRLLRLAQGSLKSARLAKKIL